MHIPDGYIGPITYGGLWVGIIPIWYYALRKIKESLRASEVPLLALAGAFSFVIMMFNVPIPGGTTGHATGAVLIAIILGPWVGVMAVSLALIIQALLFGDGGITAIGANCFNIAFAGTLSGYLVYRAILSKSKSPKRFLIASAIGSYIGINTSALLTALELGIQPILHSTPDGKPLYGHFHFP